MTAWEEIGSTYSEAATKALPLHRAFVFISGFLASLSVQHQTHLSILETIATLPLSNFVTLDKGFLAMATIANVLWAIFAATAAVIFSKGLIRLAYALVDRATNASSRAEKVEKTWISGLTVDDRASALELIESGLIEPRARLRTMTGVNEFLVGVASVFAVASWWGNGLDIVICASATVAAVFSHAISIQIFLTEYYGSALAKAQLQGKPSPHITNAR